MVELTDMQTQILQAAAKASSGQTMAPDGPPPARVKAAVKGLIKAGHILSIPNGDGPSKLMITTAGRAAIGIQNPAPDAAASEVGPQDVTPTEPLPEPQASMSAPPEESATRQTKGKLAAVVSMLQRPKGATTEAMMSATGWQAHSVRGAIAGAIKKKLGHTVVSEKVDGARTYRIVEGASDVGQG